MIRITTYEAGRKDTMLEWDERRKILIYTVFYQDGTENFKKILEGFDTLQQAKKHIGN